MQCAPGQPFDVAICHCDARPAPVRTARPVKNFLAGHANVALRRARRQTGATLARPMQGSACEGSSLRVPFPAAEYAMSLSLILLIVLILLVIGAIPAWPYSRSWGYAPSGVL